MKSNQFFSGIALVGLAASVTAGSMYVSLSAASQQEAAVEAEGVVADVGDPAAAQAVVEEVAKSINQPLAPDQVIHSRSHDVVLDASGAFSGKLSAYGLGFEARAAKGVTVKVIQEGVESGKAITDDQGNFLIAGLNPGVAALLAYSESGFMLYGIKLVATNENQGSINEIDIDSALVSAADVGIVRQLISSKLPKADLRFASAATEDEQKFPLGSGDLSTSVAGHRVQLQKDGRLRGSINLMDDRTGRIREVLDLSIYFVREGKIVAKSDVENNGEFLAAGLEPGFHSVVGVGKDGTFALGVEIVGADQEVADASSSHYRTVAVMASLEMNVAPANAGNFNSTNSSGLTGGAVALGITPPSTPAGATPGTSANGGGGSGGSGAVGGGGNLEALAALLSGGIGAALGYEAGQSNTPASPGN